MSVAGTPSPELEAANDLINRACDEVRRMLVSVDGRVPKASIQAALYLMRDVFEASAHMDKANFLRVEQLLHWAAPEVAA